jgi:DNA helicase II / ATP-dependent DNA helicase PcrA
VNYAPHFVGTIDAFLLRFVVQPFAQLLGFCSLGARLLPDALVRTLEFPSIPYGGKSFESASVFNYTLCAGTEANPGFRVRTAYGRSSEVPLEVSRRVLAAKENEWAKRGRVTHSDCQYLASRILSEVNTSSQVLSLVTTRFPVILVDEFQDTGWFLGRAMLKLLSRVRKGLVVGDPDQAIFQFAGADRALFDKADECANASSMHLDESHRSAKRIVSVVSMLSRSGKQVRALSDAPDGRAVLLVHDDAVPAAASVVAGLHAKSISMDSEVAILVRKGYQERVLQWHPFKGVSKRVCDAIAELRTGSSRKANALFAREVSGLLLKLETPSDQELAAKGIDAAQWRRCVARALFLVEACCDDESWNEWIIRVRAIFAGIADEFGLDKAALSSTLKKNIKEGASRRESTVVQTLSLSATGVHALMTIHAAKGREFDAVVVLVPKPHGLYAECPATSWWDSDPESEEREIAYVACSRAKTTLCIAVHRESYEELVRERREFVSLFEVIDERGTTGAHKTRRRRQDRSGAPD